MSELNLSLLPSTVQPESDSSIDDRWSKVVFQPKHDASPGPGSQSVTEGKIILRPPQHDHSRQPPRLPLVPNSKYWTPPLLHHFTTSRSFFMVSRLHRYHTVISQGTISLCSFRLTHIAENTHPLVKYSKFNLDCIALVVSQVIVTLNVLQVIALVAIHRSRTALHLAGCCCPNSILTPSLS